ncbi:MAG TPA: sigma-70 family RNA polymerase sigma factor [Terriglobia bacterium]|nr:sigma-70 family RNA polymerase sigma factor [Terriglobia bacterium]
MSAANALNVDDFARIYQQFHPRVLMICRRMLGSPEEAEDAANDVFLKLPGSLETYDSSQPFDRWLARVAGNHCIDLLRRRRSEQRIIQPGHDELPEPAAPLRSPVEDLLSKESSDAVRDAIFALPERYLVPLVMRYFSDLSYNEIAGMLGTSKANVGLLIFRAKQQLRAILAGGEARLPRAGRVKPLGRPGRRNRATGWLGQPAAVLGAP